MNNCTIENNYFYSFDYGVRLDGASNNLISGNIFYYNDLYDIYLNYSPYTVGSNNNTISGNTFQNGRSTGVYISYSSGNQVLSNTIQVKAVRNGIELNNSDSNIITRNSISGIGGTAAIKLGSAGYPSEDNTIYLNSIFDNYTSNVSVVGGAGNRWYSKEKLEYRYNGNDYSGYLGNYFDDYLSTYPGVDVDANGDGVGDYVDVDHYPYAIENDNDDHYPLMEAVSGYHLDFYRLTVYSLPGGSVQLPGEGEFTYAAGTLVDLAAVPEDGFKFLMWSGDTGTIEDINDPTTTITMNGDYSVTAIFSPLPQYSLTINAEHGSVTRNPDLLYYSEGSSLEAYKLTINIIGQGTTDPAPSPDLSYPEAAMVTITANPDPGWRFSHWGGEATKTMSFGMLTTSPLMFTIDSDKSLVAYFAPEGITLIGAVLVNPYLLLDQQVTLRGVYRGWESGHGSPPVTRSDWVLRDASGSIYITGGTMGKRHPGNIGDDVTLTGIVRIKGNQAYIEIPRS